MRTRTKLRIAIGLWLIGGVVIGALIIRISQMFILLLFLFLFAARWYMVNLRCPKCEKPVLKNPIRFFGTEHWITTGIMPRKCSKCGYDYDSDS